MLHRLAPPPQRPPPWTPIQSVISLTSFSEKSFASLVGDEEESGAWSGADECGADARVDSTETAGRGEALGGLEPCFERVDRVEG